MGKEIVIKCKAVSKYFNYKWREMFWKNETFYCFRSGYYVPLTSSLEYENQDRYSPSKVYQKPKFQQPVPERKEERGRFNLKYLALLH